jgi:hypothetical protein
MKRAYRANPIYPVLLLAGTAVVVYLLFRHFDRDRVTRTLAASIFTVASLLQAGLLFTQVEFERDETGFVTRHRPLFRSSRLLRVPLAEIERVRSRGGLVRVKLAGGDVVMVKLTILSRTHQKEALAWFRGLPQYVDDPFAEARATTERSG